MLIGIDIGTSACKVAAFDTEGYCIADETVGYRVYYPREGYAEQDPNEWYDAVCNGLKQLLMRIDVEKVEAIGIDGQSWSCIPVDRDGNVLHNTPIWFDMRATNECEWIDEHIGADAVFNISKNPVKPSYTTPKALWFRSNMPEIYRNTYKFLQSNAYIVYKLTGVFTQDKSQGYGHFFYDMENGRYDADLTERLGLDLNKFPCDANTSLTNCHAVVGEVTRRAAEETGLKPGIPVVAGGLDAACGTLGAGVFKTGQTQEQGGQAGGMSICTDNALAHNALILSNHVVPGYWLLQGGTVAGGGGLKWFREQFADGGFDEINGLAGSVPPASDGMIFLPYMNGERSPIWDPNAKGVYYGIGFSKTKGHFARATMEGTAYALRHNLETAEQVGARVELMHAIGGACNSVLWMHMKADITGVPIKTVDNDNATALGAAMLGGVGAGIYKDFEEAVSRCVRFKDSYEPNATNAEIYNRAYDKFRRIYEALKEEMSR